MNKIFKYGALFLLVLYFAQIVEKAIPHSHTEKAGIVLPNFSGVEDQSDHEKENSEKIHSSFYQLSLDNISLVCQFSIQLFLHNEIQLKPINEVSKNNYNILPKVLNSILFIIHTYSAKAPPF